MRQDGTYDIGERVLDTPNPECAWVFAVSWLDGRDIELDWVRDIRDRCIASNIPFFFKQWGGVQKKKAGGELDGRTWDEFPA